MIKREQGDEMTLAAEIDLMHTRLLHDLGHHELAIKAAETIRRQAEEIERLRAGLRKTNRLTTDPRYGAAGFARRLLVLPKASWDMLCFLTQKLATRMGLRRVSTAAAPPG
jgi:hypothetical protein